MKTKNPEQKDSAAQNGSDVDKDVTKNVFIEGICALLEEEKNKEKREEIEMKKTMDEYKEEDLLYRKILIGDSPRASCIHEADIIGFSPTDEYVKMRTHRSDGTSYIAWEKKKEHIVLDILGVSEEEVAAQIDSAGVCIGGIISDSIFGGED